MLNYNKKKFKWTSDDDLGVTGFVMKTTLGPFTVLIIRQAIVSLSLDFIIAVIDDTGTMVARDTKSITHIMMLVDVKKEDIMVEVIDAAALKLISVYEDWAADQIILGGNGEK